MRDKGELGESGHLKREVGTREDFFKTGKSQQTGRQMKRSHRKIRVKIQKGNEEQSKGEKEMRDRFQWKRRDGYKLEDLRNWDIRRHDQKNTEES